MLNIVLFGPPGAGKGTQSQKLIEKYGLSHLSTGDILRSEIANGTALGMEAKQTMDRGDLVSDDIVIGMIESKLDANPNAKGFIFDGFPRTQAQAVALDDLLQKKGTAISAMLALEVDNDELIKRLLLRGKDTGRPDDQDETIISNRVSEYNNKTLPLKKYYSEQSKFHSINGIGSVESIFNELVERIIFVNAEIELTMLENDIEHLDLTVNDFEEATDINPELQKDMDDVRKEEKSVKDDSKKESSADDDSKEEDETEEKPKGIIATIKEKVSHFFHTDSKEENSENKVTTPAKKKPVKKLTAKKTAATAPAKKQIAKKVASKKAPVKKAVNTVKKAVKKVAAKAPVKKAVKAVKKTATKVVAKFAKKAAPKKVVAKKVTQPVKKIAPKKAIKKAIKKVVKKIAAKTPAKKVARTPIKKVTKTVKKMAKKAAPKTAIKKAVKKTTAKAPVKKIAKAVKKIAPKKAAKKKK